MPSGPRRAPALAVVVDEGAQGHRECQAALGSAAGAVRCAVGPAVTVISPSMMAQPRDCRPASSSAALALWWLVSRCTPRREPGSPALARQASEGGGSAPV